MQPITGYYMLSVFFLNSGYMKSKSIKQEIHEKSMLCHFLVKGYNKMQRLKKWYLKFNNEISLHIDLKNNLTIILENEVYTDRHDFDKIKSILIDFVKDFDINYIDFLKIEYIKNKNDTYLLSVINRKIFKYRFQYLAKKYIENINTIFVEYGIPF